MAKFIGETGLVYLWAKIKAWVGNYAKITESSGSKSLTVGSTTATLPTKTSQLTNDSGYITSSDIPEGAAASTTTPKMDGTAAVGTETRFARGDHRHPSDTSKQDVISDLATIRSNASAGAAKVSNVQADWNASTGLAVILNKPTIPAEVTESTVAGWGFTKNTGTYSKPSTGIPKTDLANAVQTSLGKADTALQSYTETDPVFTASAAHGISSTDISTWNAKGTYSKPSGGIPKTDLASAVQTSLGKADTALQSYTETDPVFAASAAADITSSDITNWNSKTSNIGTITGINMNGASKGTSGVVDLGTVITAHQDISGKADKSTTYTKTEVDGIVDDYLSLSGGTMTGLINFDSTDAKIGITTTGRDSVDVGWDWDNRAGAGLALRKVGAESKPGNFILWARNASNSYTLEGNPAGALTWGGNSILDASNTYVSSGKGYINGTEITTISGNAATATKATQDGSGRTITSTYLTDIGINSNNILTQTKNGTTSLVGHLLERNHTIRYNLSAVGWYRIGEFMNTLNQGNSCFLFVRREFNSNNCESYMFAITAHYSGGITISQLAGHYHNHLLDKIRVDYVNNTSTKPQIDIHIATASNGNAYAFTIIGSARLFNSATANPTTIGTQYEYENLNGMGTSRDFKANGSITCTTLTQTSDERLKNKIGDINISVEDIANAPNLTFKWKEGQDTDTLYGGTYAQYWEKITPYYVHGEESDKSLEYSPLAVSCSIQLAKEIVTLKEENAQLKKELAEIKEMVSKLIK